MVAYEIYSRTTEVLHLASFDDLRKIERYDGRKVRIRGYLIVAFEGTAVYPDPRFDISRAIWLEMRSRPVLYQIFMVRGEVTVGGTLRIRQGTKYGHFGAYNAELEDAEILMPPSCVLVVLAAPIMAMVTIMPIMIKRAHTGSSLKSA